jgi:hypothetical protein
MQWGRLLFDPTTPDATFAAAYSKHLGLGSVEEGCGKRPILSHFHAKAIDLPRQARDKHGKC